MHVTRWAAGALCALAIAPTTAAQQASPSPDAGKLPPPAAAYKGVWPKLPSDTKPAEPPASKPVEWSKQEIELANARCTALLKGLDLVAVPEAPFREGTECGTPAPMKLVSVGRNPEIALSPPPVLTCDMVAALHKWLEAEVQPLARKHLGAPVVRVATMSSYSCRNAYGRARSRLSEHGRVNALDIASFVTAKGQITMVVADWGLTAREIAEQKKLEASKQEAANSSQAKEPVPPADGSAPSTGPALRPSIVIEVPGIAVIPRPDQSLGLGFSANRLGGPKSSDAAPAATPSAPAAAPLTGKAAFLRAAHRTACRIFGTVLGPEANNAHKNHFHVDMAERKNGVICE
jgi:hypothetical protein